MKIPTCRLCEKVRTVKCTLRLCDEHVKEYVAAQWQRRKDTVNAARRTGPRQPKPKPKPQPKPKARRTYRYTKPLEPEPIRDIRPTKPVRPVRHFDPEAVRLQFERAAYIRARLNSF